MMIAIFNSLNSLFVLLAKFPVSSGERLNLESSVTLFSLLKKRHFWVPALMAACIWAVMAMPMSVGRMAMQQLGFSARQSLLTIELHFLGMFSPGFITGNLLKRFGAMSVSGMLMVIVVVALTLHLIASSASIVPWILGLVILGVGWNFGFSASTVLLAQSYDEAPLLKAKVQGANEFVMFMFAGSLIFSTGYIYEAGGSELAGWKTVNYVVIGLTAIMVSIALYECCC